MTQHPPLARDPRHEDGPRLLIVLNRYEETSAATAGAELRQAALVYALRRLVPADVMSIVTLRELQGCGPACAQDSESCNAGVDPELRRPWPYCIRAEEALGRLLRDSDYAGVLLSHVPTHQYIRTVQEHTDAPVLIDFHNAEADLEQEMVAHPDYPRLRADDADEWTGMERVERYMFESADVVSVPSNLDRQRFIQRYGDRPIVVVPNAVTVPDRMPQAHEFRPRTCFFLGALDYFPNTRAALEIIERIAPVVAQELPDMHVQVAGRRPPRVVIEAAADHPVELTPDVDDARPLFRNSVLLVPLDCGGGTRLKVLEAFAAGCPVISTAKGMEGIDAEPTRHYLQAEDAESFVAALRIIIEEPAADLERRRNAWNLVGDNYSRDAIVRPLKQALTTAGVPCDPAQ